ncbi:MAG: thymidine phosphorylase [Zavarzinella sp.]
MLAVDIIKAKRDGKELTEDEIANFVYAAATGDWPDYQLSALLMAIFLRGMTAEETAMLTGFMAQQGQRFQWDDFTDRPLVDKHSTGGVGDKTSLVLAPLLAACGCYVPMMSGRGLGHTGGTLDKLEAIPGFRVRLEEAEIRPILQQVGCCMFGQTSAVAPADRKLYSLRDVTGTVENIPLITASILSKKIAEGTRYLVMDVKVGRGAFMKHLADAQALAESIVQVGNANNVTTTALLTRMDQPLGNLVGHTLEVVECLEMMRGTYPADLGTVTFALAEEILLLTKIAPDQPTAQQMIQRAITSGKVLENFQKMIEMQGGDARIVDNYDLLPHVRQIHQVCSDRTGYLTQLDAEAFGIATLRLGGGRAKAEDEIDHAVGIRLLKKLGDPVQKGEPICDLFFRTQTTLNDAIPHVVGGIEVAEVPPEVPISIVATIA